MAEAVFGRGFSCLCRHLRIAVGLDRADRQHANGIAAWLDTLGYKSVLVYEATSSCESDLINPLATRGHVFSRVNLRDVRQFAKAAFALTTSDRVDVRLLAQMGAALDLLATSPLSPA